MTAPQGGALPLAQARVPVDVADADLDADLDAQLGQQTGAEPGAQPGQGLPNTTLVLGRRAGRPVALLLAPAGARGEALRALADDAVQDLPPLPWTPPDPLPSAAVVITTIRPGDDLRATVLDALAQSLPPAEVIVVDNRPSTSGVREWLAAQPGASAGGSLGDAVRYVPEPLPGLARARNAGLRATSAEVVAFTDDDVRLDPDWLARLAGGFDDGVDAVTGLVLPRGLHTEAQLLMERFGGFSKGLRPLLYDLVEHRGNDPLFPFSVGVYGSGANAAFRTRVLRAVGGFDPRLGTGRITRGGEDLDIFLRLVLAGHRLAYEPAAVVRHDHEAEMDAFSQRVLGYGVGLGAVLGKHFASGRAVRGQMLRRLPAAVAHLREPDSPKNAQKGQEYPARYTWLERAGILAGPFTYFLAREQDADRPPAEWAAGSAGSAATTRPAEPTLPSWPIWCTDVELSRPVPPVLRAPEGAGHRTARVLLRVGRRPVGSVTLPLTDGALDGRRLLEAAGPLLREHRPEPEPGPAAAGAEPPEVTVAVCTRDRGELLGRCLRSLQALTYARLDVLVVDNAPTDDGTREVFEATVGADARFRYVVEPVPGLSRARNRAVREARGEILAFTDDDVDVDPWWVQGLVAGFTRSPRVGCVTGMIATAGVRTAAEAYFDGRVTWGSSFTPRVFALDLADAGALFPYTPGVFGAGADFACRTELLRRLGGFDEALGAGTLTGGGEDLDLFVRVLQSGAELAYEPAALVWHHHRTELAGLRRQMYAYGSGLTAFLTKHLLDRATRRQVLRRIPAGLGRMLRVPAPGTADVEAPAATTSQRPEPARLRSTAMSLLELRGRFAGPVLYVRSARRAHRTGRSDVAAPLPRRDAARDRR